MFSASPLPSMSSSSTPNSSPPKRATRVGRAERAAQTLGDADEHLVTACVAVAVVDELEVVDVDEEHADEPVGAPLAGQRVADAVVEQRAVGELRQRVVEGAVTELVLELLARADVARGQDRAGERVVAGQRGRDRLHVAPAAVAVTQAPLGPPRRPPRVAPADPGRPPRHRGRRDGRVRRSACPRAPPGDIRASRRSRRSGRGSRRPRRAPSRRPTSCGPPRRGASPPRARRSARASPAGRSRSAPGRRRRAAARAP